MAIANAATAPEKSLQPSPLALTLGYLRRNKSLTIGLVILLALVLFTVTGFMTIDPKHAYPLSAAPKKPPSLRYPLGTDFFGRDLYAAMVVGMRQTALIGLLAGGIGTLIGVVLGFTSAYFGGWVDTITSRATEIVMCIPTLVLILAIIAILEKPTIWHTMAIIGATGWTGIARLTRGEFLRLKNTEFVLAARAAGAGPLRIMLRHILPNALAPVLVPITFGIASAILTESSLSFLGFGPPPPTASWGSLLNDARSNLAMWWLVVFPGLAIFLTVLAYNLVGEGLQEATDPRLREARK